MHQLVLIPVHFGITALVAAGHGIALQIAVGHLATTYAAHAATHLAVVHGAAATAHGAAAMAPAHVGQALHGVQHVSANPMSGKLVKLLEGATLSVGSLTFVNLYDHMLDAEWEKEKKHHRVLSVKRQQDLLKIAHLSTKVAMENRKEGTVEELHKLAKLVQRVLAMLAPMPPAAGTAPA